MRLNVGKMKSAPSSLAYLYSSRRQTGLNTIHKERVRLYRRIPIPRGRVYNLVLPTIWVQTSSESSILIYYPQKSCIAVPTLFRARFMLSKAHGNFKYTPQCAYKGSKKKVILSNSTRKKWDLERFPLKNLTRRANFFTTQQYKCKHLLHSLLKNLELTKILPIFAT